MLGSHAVTQGRGSDPWVKAQAVMPAVVSSEADLIAMVDADVWIPEDGLEEAILAVRGGAAWAIPHRGVHRLDQDGTRAVMAGAPWRDQCLVQRAYLGFEGGGCVVAPRENFLSVPLDPRFVGWGQEDESWGMALATLLGRPWRGSAPLVHLWHPPQPRPRRRRGCDASWALYKRYLAANGNRPAMQALIEEIHAQELDKQAVHDRDAEFHRRDRRSR